jgi:hypothetical protein
MHIRFEFVFNFTECFILVGRRLKGQHLISVDNPPIETPVSLLQGAIVALIPYAVAYQLVYFVRYELKIKKFTIISNQIRYN